MQKRSIENYGIIGNMRSAALVSIEGAIEFFCFPNFDSPSVFAALLDEDKGGSFRIDPQIASPRTKQLYLPDTNILLTRFLSEEGVAELTDFMPVPESGGSNADPHRIIRTIRVIRGELQFKLRCAPRFDYARGEHTVHSQEHAIIFRPHGEPQAMALHATVPLDVDGADER